MAEKVDEGDKAAQKYNFQPRGALMPIEPTLISSYTKLSNLGLTTRMSSK